LRANSPSFGASTALEASRGTSSRTRPAGLFRRPDTRLNALLTSESAGRICARRCSPASVGATLLVVRESSRTPTRSSSPRMAWLIAEGDTPNRLAARVKLRSSATTTKADNALRSFSGICEFYSQTLARESILSSARFRHTVVVEKKTSRALQATLSAHLAPYSKLEQE